MRLSSAPATIVALLALLPIATAKPYPARQITTQVEVREISTPADVEKRQCDKTCGWEGKLCCKASEECGVNDLNQAVCVAGSQQQQNDGSWKVWTETLVETGVQTKTAVFSSWMPEATGKCTGAQVECGNICCDGGYWCPDPANGVCKLLGGPTSPGLHGTGSPSAPMRPTASTLIVITATGSATKTVSFETPIATGVNGTLIPAEGGGGALSGGAIAGIVIGVILGVILLLLLCLYCCAKTVFDGFAALLGFGKKRKHTHEETYIEEHHHHSHHGSAAGAAAMGGRRWYGQQSGRPSRPPPKKKHSGLGGAMGIGAGLAGLAIALGLKRKHDRRRYDDDKTTTVSGTSGYTYSDYTSTSSASSDDRHTRPTRHSSRR